jgi:hypothetical protein
MKWAWYVANMRNRKLAENFKENPEGKISYGRHRRRNENNIKLDLTAIA